MSSVTPIANAFRPCRSTRGLACVRSGAEVEGAFPHTMVFAVLEPLLPRAASGDPALRQTANDDARLSDSPAVLREIEIEVVESESSAILGQIVGIRMPFRAGNGGR